MRARLVVLGGLVAAACGDGGSTSPDAPPTDLPDAAAFDAPLSDVAPPDATPPDANSSVTVTIVTPTDGQRVLGSRVITVSGTLASTRPIADVVVDLGGVVAPDVTFDQTSFSAEVTLGDRWQSITVTATDAGGFPGTAFATVDYPFVALTTFAPAQLVLGQPDFVTRPDRAVDASSIPYPYGFGAWHDGVLYWPSSDHNRVLGWRGFPARANEPADFALGQPDLATSTIGSGAAGMDFPQSVVVADGKLFVLDWGGSRVLVWNTPPTTTGVAADYVIGQASLDATATGCTQALTNYPDDFFVAGGRVFVSDRENHRLLIWNTIPTASGVPPDVVLGQGDFTHCTANDDDQDGVTDAAPSARTLRDPIGVWSDGTRLALVDQSNHRVLVWNTVPTASFTPADVVLGQPDFTSATPGTAADALRSPSEVTSNGNQFVIGDGGNHRVLIWDQLPAPGTPPDVVLGQSDASHGAPNDDDQDGTEDATCSARTLRGFVSPHFTDRALIVSDIDNSRALVFGELPCAAGLYEPPGMPGTCLADPCQPDPCTGGQICRNDTGAAVCE